VTDLHMTPVAADRVDTYDELVVLHSLRPPDGTTKYVDHMVGGAPPGVAVRFFSWTAALVARYDVLHVHWPELLIRDSRRPWMRVVKRRLLDLLLLRLWLQRIPLVWTAHNLEPHEAVTAAERRSLDRFSRRVDVAIRLNLTSPVTVGRETVTIPTAHPSSSTRSPRPSRDASCTSACSGPTRVSTPSSARSVACIEPTPDCASSATRTRGRPRWCSERA
jgi:hypothetical protein